jgi:hypothetical protein
LFNALLDADRRAAKRASCCTATRAVEFMNATDSRDMCRCRLEQAHKDWIDSELGFARLVAWKESMSDGEHDRGAASSATSGSPGLQVDKRRPDVLVSIAAFMPITCSRATRRLCFAANRLTANVPLRVAAVEADELLELAEFVHIARRLRIWRATNSVSSASQRLGRAPFAALSRFVAPLLLKRGVHVFNATESLSLHRRRATHASRTACTTSRSRQSGRRCWRTLDRQLCRGDASYRDMQ